MGAYPAGTSIAPWTLGFNRLSENSAVAGAVREVLARLTNPPALWITGATRNCHQLLNLSRYWGLVLQAGQSPAPPMTQRPSILPASPGWTHTRPGLACSDRNDIEPSSLSRREQLQVYADSFGFRRVQPLPHFLSRFEVYVRFVLDRDGSTGPRISTGPGRPMTHRK
jgi:hypothetical protein